jgi:hypothetical protein
MVWLRSGLMWIGVYRICAVVMHNMPSMQMTRVGDQDHPMVVFSLNTGFSIHALSNKDRLSSLNRIQNGQQILERKPQRELSHWSRTTVPAHIPGHCSIAVLKHRKLCIEHAVIRARTMREHDQWLRWFTIQPVVKRVSQMLEGDHRNSGI